MKALKKLIALFLLFFILISFAYAQTRSFNDIFPGINTEIRSSAFSESGYVKSSRKTEGFIITGNAQGSGLDSRIVNDILRRDPGYLVESMMIIPGMTVTLLDVYNALSNIRDLKGRLYDSATRNRSIPLFEEATRIVSERQNSEIPDPAPATTLPQRETFYIKLKDANFGNTFYKAEISVLPNGIRYRLSNFRSMSYLFVPVIREEKFIAQLYFEPIREGILIYSLAGTDVSDFLASKIHIDSAISKRLAVITSWAADGIRKGR